MRVVALIVVAVGSYAGWTAAISDHDSNTFWTVLLAAALYGALLALIFLLGRFLWSGRRR
jgi:hypothetical protein